MKEKFEMISIENYRKDFEVKPALFLDLDLTIRYSKSGKFINKPEDVILYEGVEEKIWEYRNNGYLIFGITNQGGVAFGFKSHEGNVAEIEQTINLFENNPFHSIKYSYFHAEGNTEPFCYRSLLRKPDYGMLVLCEIDARKAGYIIDWSKSLFVGDMDADKDCAGNAGIDFEWADVFFNRAEEK